MKHLHREAEHHTRAGASAIEVIVVVLIFLVILALSAPYLQRAREKSRNVNCQNNLRRIGESMRQFAAENNNSQLCSGAVDYLRDGCPDQFGWTTDLFLLKGMAGGTYICPSHSQRANVALLDVSGVDGQTTTILLPPDLRNRLRGDCGEFEVDLDGDGIVDQGTVPAGAKVRVEYANQLIRRGLITNYTPSWYLVRSGMTYSPAENGQFSTSPDWDADQLGATLGPITLQLIDRSPIPSQNIPLMAEGAPVRTVPESIKLETLSKDSQLVATMLTGPAAWDESSESIVPMPRGVVADRLPADECQVGPFCGDVPPTLDDPGDGGVDGKLWLQDTRHWAPQHPDFSRGVLTLNILMADGSVKQMLDLNGDGFLNPGFPIESSKDSISNQVELPPFLVYSGEIVNREAPVKVFEEQ